MSEALFNSPGIPNVTDSGGESSQIPDGIDRAETPGVMGKTEFVQGANLGANT